MRCIFFIKNIYTWLYNHSKEFDLVEILINRVCMTDNNSNNDEAQFYSELLRVFFDSANDAIFVLCDEMKFLICNAKTQQWLGYSEAELTLHNNRIPITDLLGNPDSIGFFKLSFQQALKNEEAIFETKIKPEKGKERWIELVMKRVEVESGDMVIAVARDVTQRKKDLATIEYRSNYDPLTNLPNRNYLVKNILTDEYLKNNSIQSLTLLGVDIDRFKEINESLGKETGDNVLQEIARRLNRMIDHPASEMLARLEGDEYVIVLPNTLTYKANDIAVKIKQVVSMPLSIGASKISIGCSVGIANFPDHTQDPQELIQLAESAMYTAKANNQGIGVYDSEFYKTTKERIQLVADFRDALESHLIVPYYQPIINIENINEIRIEVLARWEHKEHGFISPEVFIQIAEEIGMINELTISILNQSIKECSDLIKSGVVKTMSVNISAYCMSTSDICDEIKCLLSQYSVPAKKIVFEITESAMMYDLQLTEEIINEIHQCGVVFSIDDFGTGYSSLFKLKQLPLSELKIDKAFVTAITENEDDAAIVKASIQMAHALGFKVVAEGIESKKSWDLLHELGCDYGQGFWMAKPMHFEQLTVWFEDEKVFS